MTREKNHDLIACNPIPLVDTAFNNQAIIPYGLHISHIKSAMNDFLEFLGFINTQMHTKKIPRLEHIMMTANFSSLVGEFMVSSMPKYCETIAKNGYHNGHPDLLPANVFPNNTAQHVQEGIEVKGSRHKKGW